MLVSMLAPRCVSWICGGGDGRLLRSNRLSVGDENRLRNGVVFEGMSVDGRSSCILLLVHRTGSCGLDSRGWIASGMDGRVDRIGRKMFDGTRCPFRLGNGRHRRW